MRVIHVVPEGRKPNRDDIMIGDVVSQLIVGEESASFRLNEVTFRDGGRNRLHVHPTDQILVVISGEGTLGGDEGEHDLRDGDVALISAGERHWHGAKPGRHMTHWSILGPGETRIVG